VITLSTLDVVIILGYFVVIFAVGFLSGSRRRDDAVDFLLAGRSLTTPIFVMTLVSTWYGGILGVGEFSYQYGLSNWVTQGLPYYLFAAVFAFLLAGRIRATNLVSIPDKLLQSYDRKTALLGAMLAFILMTPAPYVLMLAVLLKLASGWPMALCLLIGTAASTVYLYAGGFRADVNTNVAEFFMMFLGFAIILPFAYNRFGGWDFIASHVPPLHLTWHGGNSIQFILVWFFIALWTLVDPSFHQRCYAAKSGKVARNGILLSILFWLIFDAMTTTAGLYARAVLPGIDQPVMAYPLIAERTLPAGAKGIFYVGMLATVMSALNSFTFVSATALGRDIIWRTGGSRKGWSETGLTRIGLVVSALLAIALAAGIPSVVRLWYTIGTIIIPGLLIPVVASYFNRIRVGANHAFAAMLAAWLTALGWLLAGWTHAVNASGSYPLGLEPMYAGVAVSTMVWGWGMVKKRNRDMTPTATSRP
jgi:solute:Na+ symporter, SSS family